MTDVRDVAEAPSPRSTPTALLQLALQQGADLDKLERLLEMQRKWEETEAKKLYAASMTAFKKAAPEILKRKLVSFDGAKGKTEYMHAELADVCDAIIGALADVGIYHRWTTEQSEGKVKVTCTLTHTAGHTEASTLEAGHDASGGKNSIQAIASTVTYLERYTLLAASGLATKSMTDNDGRGATTVANITATQAEMLNAMIEDTGTDRAKLLEFLKVETIEALPADCMDRAIGALQAKRRQKKGAPT
jgi:hypothetical protein